MKLQGFSLVELVITTVLMSLLIGVLFQSYGYISHTAINLQSSSALQKELLYVIQALQNDIDGGTITITPGSGGIVWDDTIEIEQGSGSFVRYFRQCDMKQKCGIVRYDGTVNVLLTDPEKVHVSIFNIGHLTSNKAKGFWFRSHFAYSKNASLGLDVQTFFTSR